MKKTFVYFLIFLIFPFLLTGFNEGNLWACPNCAGMSTEEKDQYTVIILATFIALTYIPFYLIFRLMKKFK